MANSLNKVTTKSILDATIATADIADDAVTEDKLANAINTSIAGKAVLTGSTDNTICTVTGANAISGEANLIFDGDNLGVGITPVIPFGADKTLHINSSATSGARGASIHLTAGNFGTTNTDGSKIVQEDTALIIQNMENEAIYLGTNATHRVKIEGDGDVGIGTTSPETTLSVDGSVAISSNNVTVSPSGFDLKIRSNTCKLGIHTDNASDLPTLEFGIGNTNGGKITTSGNGALQICPNNTEEARFLSGGGLTFNGDTAAANALDDYEEGTFTPLNVSMSAVSDAYTGRYTKIGNQVFISVSQTAGTVSFSAGNAIKGLPFTVSGTTVVSITNRQGNINGNGYTYQDGSDGKIYVSFAASSQTSLEYSCQYVTTA